MASATGWFVLGLVLLALGGDSVVRGASGLSRRMGWSPFVVGMVLVALATSLPELAVNFQAVAQGQADLGLGNAVGSNVVNVGLTLAVAAIAAPLVVRWRALSSLLLSALGATGLVLLLSIDGRISALEGAMLVLVFTALLALAIRRSRHEAPEVRAEIEAFTRTGDGLGLNLMRLAIAAALLGYGGWLIARHAPDMGEAIGLSPLMTGLLPVAIGTALPELAAAIAAARRGQGDLVAGHVIGSSLVNMLLVIGGMAVLAGGLRIPESFVRFELPAALVFTLMLLPVLRGDMRVSRAEGGVLALALLAWIGFELLMLRG